MPSRCACRARTCRRAARHAGQADEAEHLVDPGSGDVVARGERGQMRAGAAARMERPGLQQRADLRNGQRQLARTGGRRSAPRPRRGVQSEDHPHRRGLAGSVRAEEAGHHARPDVEAQRVDRDTGP